VGVAPAGFHSLEGPVEPAVWYPIPREQREHRGWFSLRVVGRLAPDATIAQAQAQLDAAAVRLAEEHPRYHRDDQDQPLPIRVFTEREGRIPAGQRAAVLAGVSGVFGLAGLILALAASNVANLLLGRATQRQPEIAVRLALGASRPRIVRQLLAESLILAVVSGGLALLVVRLGLIALTNGVVQMLPAPLTLAIDMRVAVFATSVAIGAGLLFGLAPALHASRFDLMSTIRRAGTDVSRFGLRRLIVNVQVAGAVVLTATALLFLHSVSRAGGLDPGFDPSGVAVITVDLDQRQYEPERAAAFFDDATRRLAAAPGVSAVAWARTVPLSGNSTASVTDDIEDYEPLPGERVLIGLNYVTPGYFDLVRIPLRAGREFTAEDRDGAPSVVIVNEAFADRFWPGQNPIGKRIEQSHVVGVTANIRAESLNDLNQPFMWYPVEQVPQPLLIAHVRTQGDPAVEAVRLARVVNTLDPYLLIDGRSMEEVTSAATLAQRLLSIVFATAGLAALALAMMGVYGVMAFLVTLRTREMGVRIALGAAPGLLVRRTVIEGIRMTLLGAAIGLGVSIIVAFAAQATLVGVRPLDPATLVGAAVLILSAATLATLIPAHRASRISPTVALRQD
jgi:predicted permease